RVALHIITGGSDAEQTRDGDWLDHDTRYRRTDEYLTVLRRMWTAPEPFDHEGEFYRFSRAFSGVKPLRPGGVPLSFGGARGAAAGVAAKHCDVYAVWGEPLAAVKQRIADIHEQAAAFGRRPRISVSLRPIIAPTEAQAWERARRILAKVMEARPSVGGGGAGVRPTAAGVGGAGNPTALVGTPEQVAESLLDYYDIGCTTLLIRGFDPLNDAIDYGRELIPRVRAEAARRDRVAMVGA